MTRHLLLIYTLFFLSGAAGLMYEIVWGRMLIYIFGSTTSSAVATISAFLAGLAAGSLIAGKFADKFSSKQLLSKYAFIELLIGFTAALSLLTIPLLTNIYALFSDGSNVTFQLLFFKFALTSVIIIIPTSLMGATFPILVNYVKSVVQKSAKAVSYLYAINTLGAVFGVLLAGFIFIEILGLRNTAILYT